MFPDREECPALRTLMESTESITCHIHTAAVCFARNKRQPPATVDMLQSLAAKLDEQAARFQSLRDRAHAELAMVNNRRVPVNTLPPEVLGIVFLELAGDRFAPLGRHGEETVATRADRNKWLRVTAVCRHWRELSLRLPLLWNVLDYGGISRAASDSVYSAQWLRRAGMAPLTIDIQHLSSLNLNTLEDLASRCNQIRELRILNTDATDKLAAFNAPAPLLDHLSIQINAGKILPTMFDGQTPLLRSLTLTGSVELSENRFRDISRLHLLKQSFRTRDQFMQLLTILQLSPRLAELHASRCEDDDLDDADPIFGLNETEMTLSLPELVDIRFTRCSPEFVRGILGRTVFEENQAVKLKLTLEDIDTLDLPTIFPSRLHPLHMQPTELQLFLDCRSQDDPLEVILSAPSAVLAISLDGSFECPSFEEVGRELIAHIIEILPVSSLTTVCLAAVSLGLLPSWKEWRNMLGQLTSVATLVVNLSDYIDHPEEWLRALTDVGLGDGRYPAPSLQTLRIMPPETNVSDEAFSLVAVVSNRYVSGHGLKTLDIFDGGPDPEQHSEPAKTTFMRWVAEKGELEAYVASVNVVAAKAFPLLLPRHADIL